MSLLDTLTGMRRITVRDMERAIVLESGRVSRLLGPGEHSIFDPRWRAEIERHDISTWQFNSKNERALLERLPREHAEAFEVVETGSDEVALVEHQGRIVLVIRPEKRVVLWRAAGPYKVTRIDAAHDLEVSVQLRRRLVENNLAQHIVGVTVTEGNCALVYVDGAFEKVVGPGLHSWWSVGRQVSTKQVDLRKQSADVNGQELLTRDRVTIRVNLSAEYRVADPVRMAGVTGNHTDMLYRCLQRAFRKTLGAMTLDQILERKEGIDDSTAEEIRAEMSAIGLEVYDISLKDIILPGEMRDILNRVVTAQKEAEANIIRRREETNATRSLLNTAKVMAENPIMLRLKELETLEQIAGKVERLTINNGTSGLLNDVARLREP